MDHPPFLSNIKFKIFRLKFDELEIKILDFT